MVLPFTTRVVDEASAVDEVTSASRPKQQAAPPAATVRVIIDGLRGILWIPIF